MALSAIRRGGTQRWVRAFASSILSSPSPAALPTASDSSAKAGLSHSFGYSQLYGFQRPCPPWRHLLARCRSWTEFKDCKHWFITLRFPKDPAPTGEEMIDAYVKTLAAVLGSEEEAKKKIYAVSTTAYTGFQCNIDEATSERVKEQPLVSFVLPDVYGDPELGDFGGDRYNNGVITPDPNPIIPNSEGRRERNFDRPRFDRPRDFRPMEGRDNMPREQRDDRRGDNYSYRSRDSMQGDKFDHRPPFEQRNPMQGYQRERMPMEGRDNMPREHRDNRPERRDSMQGDQFDNMPPFEQRRPMQGFQREYMRPDARRPPIPPIDRRDSYKESEGIPSEGQREAVPGQGQGKY